MARTDTEQLVVQLEARIRDFEKNFEKAQRTASRNWQNIERRGERASRKIERDMRQATAGVTAFANSLKGVVAGLGVGVGVAGLQQLVTESLNVADAIGEMAEVADVSTGFLQEMRYAAQLSGVEVRGLDDSLRRLNRRVGLFIADGGGPAAKALERLGLASRIASGELRGTEPIFLEVVRALQGAESQAERAALASQLFGDDFGPKLVPLLDQGTAGINRLREEARRLGVVMSDEVIAKAARANDILDKMSLIIRTKTAIGVVELTDDFRELVEAIQPIIDWLIRLAYTFESVGDALSSMNLFENTLREIETLKEFLRSLGADIREVKQEASGLGSPVEVDIRDDSIPGPNPPATGTATGTTTEKPKAPLPAFKPEIFGPPAAGTPEAAVFEEIARGKQMIEEAEQAAAALQNRLDQVNQVGQRFATTLASGLTSAITGAQSFDDALRNMLRSLAQAVLQAIILQAIMSALGSPGTVGAGGAVTGASGILGLIGKGFAGGFASGGFIPAGQFGLVGERGPELVTGPANVRSLERPVQSIAVNSPVTINVEGGSRGEEADRQLAGRIGAEVERVLDAKIEQHIRNATRTGNILNPYQQPL